MRIKRKDFIRTKYSVNEIFSMNISGTSISLK